MFVCKRKIYEKILQTPCGETFLVFLDVSTSRYRITQLLNVYIRISVLCAFFKIMNAGFSSFMCVVCISRASSSYFFLFFPIFLSILLFFLFFSNFLLFFLFFSHFTYYKQIFVRDLNILSFFKYVVYRVH